jgi:hypothetical protein
MPGNPVRLEEGHAVFIVAGGSKTMNGGVLVASIPPIL